MLYKDLFYQYAIGFFTFRRQYLFYIWFILGIPATWPVEFAYPSRINGSECTFIKINLWHSAQAQVGSASQMYITWFETTCYPVEMATNLSLPVSRILAMWYHERGYNVINYPLQYVPIQVLWYYWSSKKSCESHFQSILKCI